jgi:hypothetical protein
MSIFKKLNKQDVNISQFDTHKSWDITDSNISGSGVSLYTAYYTGSSSDNYSIDDPNNHKKWFQLNRLFYQNYPINPDLYKNQRITSIDKLGNETWKEVDNPGTMFGANSLLGNPDYDTTERKLYDKVNIISIASKVYGRKIKPTTFYLSGSFNGGSVSKVLKDDGYENLYDSKYDSYDFKTNADRALYISSQREYVNYELPTLYTRSSNSSGAILLPDNQLNGVVEDNKSDDSLRYNEYKVNNIIYSEGLLGPKMNFNPQTSSSIEVYHNNNFNYDKEEDFAISAIMSPYTGSNSRQWVMVKSFNEDYIPSPEEKQLSFELKQRENQPQYPFALYIESGSIYFERNDGQNLTTLSSSIDSNTHSIIINKTGSLFEFYKDGNLVASGSDNSEFLLRNKSNILIGSKNKKEGFYSGSLEHIMIFDTPLTSNNVTALSESICNSPNVGNIFYETGFATITNPNYQDILLVPNSKLHDYSLQFKGSHTIWEYEYMCHVEPEDFLYTNNITARKIPSNEVAELADFTTGSEFRPYVTSIGLYNNEGELLAIGKLGQPVKMPNKIDTNFVLRFDK